jgi:NADH-quinone oxidoreductase subunit A
VLPSDYAGILILLVLGILVGVGALSISHFLGARREYPNKESPYECGIPSIGAEGERFSVRFYLVAVSFILFDIETVFLVPWAVQFKPAILRGDGPFVLALGFVFLVVLTLGLAYEWKKGLLDWNR